MQYRDKTSDTGDLVRIAKKLHEITKRYNVPLIINDRVDVAVASGAEGVHLGQDDMSKDKLSYPYQLIWTHLKLRANVLS